MHSTELGSNSVPAFLSKLWKLVDDSKYDKLIHWAPSGLSFIIHDQTQFAKDVLPQYFKHNNMASFIRQLNMYGFKKLINIEQGGLKVEKDEMEFQHQYFIKDNESYLTLIKRKLPGSKSPQQDVKVKNEVVNRMIADVSQLRGHQEEMDSKFETMKQENQALWREVANLRQKHMKQQQIVNKLIQFLLTLVQPNRGIGVTTKRKLPLMINDTSHTPSKVPSLARRFGAASAMKGSDDDSLNCKIGPVIHDVTDLLKAGEDTLTPHNIAEITVGIDSTEIPEEVADVGSFAEQSSSASPKTEFPASPCVQSVAGCSQNDASAVDFQLPDPSIPIKFEPDEVIFTDAAIPLETALQSVIGDDEPSADTSGEVALLSSSDMAKMELSTQVDTLQTDLDNIRDYLSGGGYNLNASTLLGVRSANIMNTFLDEAQLFNPSDESLSTAGLPDDVFLGDKNEITGNELMKYTPSFPEFGHDDSVTGLDFADSDFDIESVLSEVNNSDFVLNTPDPMLSAPSFGLGKKQSKPSKS